MESKLDLFLGPFVDTLIHSSLSLFLSFICLVLPFRLPQSLSWTHSSSPLCTHFKSYHSFFHSFIFLPLFFRLPQSLSWTRSSSRLRTHCGSWWPSLYTWWPWSSISSTDSVPSGGSSWPRITTPRRTPSICPVPCGLPGAYSSTVGLGKVGHYFNVV